MENGEKEICELWRKTRKWSLDEFTAIYKVSYVNLTSIIKSSKNR